MSGLVDKLGGRALVWSPEFLREGFAVDVEKPAGTGGHGVAHLFDPVNGRDHDLGGDFPGQFLV